MAWIDPKIRRRARPWKRASGTAETLVEIMVTAAQ